MNCKNIKKILADRKSGLKRIYTATLEDGLEHGILIAEVSDRECGGTSAQCINLGKVNHKGKEVAIIHTHPEQYGGPEFSTSDILAALLRKHKFICVMGGDGLIECVPTDRKSFKADDEFIKFSLWHPDAMQPISKTINKKLNSWYRKQKKCSIKDFENL